MRAIPILAVLLALASPRPSSAQTLTGEISGTVLDAEGAPLEAVTVALLDGSRAAATTDHHGRFRFLGLSPGPHRLRFELAPAPAVEAAAQVAAGRTTALEVRLGATDREARSGGPLPPFETRTGVTLDRTALERIPTARDPWALLPQAPGVLTDRVNVAGSESGVQTTYAGPGSPGSQAVWRLDGVDVTDMVALGSSPFYYDFDSFEQVRVTTGGPDAAVASGGVVLDLVTRRGGEEWRGSGRIFLARDGWQADFDADPADLAPSQSGFTPGSRVREASDYGLELGGPLMGRRLWVWAGQGRQEVDRVVAARSQIDIEATGVRLDARLAAGNSAALAWRRADKVEPGRDGGPARPPETTWNQSGPSDLFRLEDTQLAGASLLLTGLAARLDAGFELVPRGGLDVNASQDASGAFHNTFLLYRTERPQTQVRAEGTKLAAAGRLAHELRFGAGYREAGVESLSRWPGIGLQLDYYRAYGAPYDVIQLYRDAAPAATIEAESAWLQDTMTTGTAGGLTAHVGVRYDRQGGTNEARTVRANPAVPDLLPEIRYPGGGFGYEWESIAPRLGLAWTPGRQRATRVRAGYARFADQLGGRTATWLNPLYPASYVALSYDDRNGNGQAEPGELVGSYLFTSLGYDPAHPETPLRLNAVDPGLDPPRTDELLAGVDHAWRPGLVVSLDLTWRRIAGLLETDLLVFDSPFAPARPHTAADYEPFTVSGVLPGGEPYEVTAYRLRPGLFSLGGRLLRNGDREQVYRGAALRLERRLAGGWMLRGHLNLQDWEWDVPEGALADPTPLLPGGARDGDAVLQGSATGGGGLKSGVYLGSGWSYGLSGLVQVGRERRWGFDVAWNLYGREGYPVPYFRRIDTPRVPGAVSVLAVAPDEVRLDDLHVVDLRLAKEVALGSWRLTVGADVFNLLDAETVLQRRHRLGVANEAHVSEVLAPRTLRLGARVSFR